MSTIVPRAVPFVSDAVIFPGTFLPSYLQWYAPEYGAPNFVPVESPTHPARKTAALEARKGAFDVKAFAGTLNLSVPFQL